ncbi:hypothetical protein DERP_002578 [Dermatophagoides pteronyssinus]|uniref:Uncharacterized protein n=1 Tax=Dermatophagoides pteronyssinus TaxID=6956 RepID=A0ABQ8JI43_DERPT|nr:hypothetical protein DERP_002578 [Dermatophagoides pteronyssinus]
MDGGQSNLFVVADDCFVRTLYHHHYQLILENPVNLIQDVILILFYDLDVNLKQSILRSLIDYHNFRMDSLFYFAQILPSSETIEHFLANGRTYDVVEFCGSSKFIRLCVCSDGNDNDGFSGVDYGHKEEYKVCSLMPKYQLLDHHIDYLIKFPVQNKLTNRMKYELSIVDYKSQTLFPQYSVFTLHVHLCKMIIKQCLASFTIAK